MWETRVQSLNWEDPLVKTMTTCSSTLAWKIPWTEKPTVRGIEESWTRLSDFTFTLIAQLVKTPCLQCRRPRFDSWVGKIPWRKERLPTVVLLGFPCGSAGKESSHSMGDLGSISGLGRSPGEGKGYLLWYSGLENSMDCIVPGVAKSWTWPSDFHSLHLCTFNVCLYTFYVYVCTQFYLFYRTTDILFHLAY